MMDLDKELAAIGQLLSSATLLMAVRDEVRRVKKSGFVVTDAAHHPGAEGYDVVVEGGDEKTARRIQNAISGVNVDRIADGVLGIRSSRRGGRL